MSKIYLDLDGCFVDFVRGVFTKYGKPCPQDVYDGLKWDFDKTHFADTPGFWDGLDYEFWKNLGWTPVGEELYHAILNRFGAERLYICTSPVRTHGCVDGKIDWITKNMPELARRFIIAPNKDFGSGILLDDRSENVDNFGGKGLLYPQPWNRYGYENQSVDKIVNAITYWVD